LGGDAGGPDDYGGSRGTNGKASLMSDSAGNGYIRLF
jgi:hypothetical protein